MNSQVGESGLSVLLPVTRAQRWVLALGHMRVGGGLLLSHLGGQRGTPEQFFSGQKYILDCGEDFDKEKIEAHLEAHLGPLPDTYLPGPSGPPNLSPECLKLYDEFSIEQLHRGAIAVYIGQGVEMVHRAFVAGYFTPTEAWSWLFRMGKEAQKHFLSFEEYWNTCLFGYRLVVPQMLGGTWHKNEQELHRNHPLGIPQILPWREDLTVELPWTPPALISLRFAVTIECLLCAAEGPLSHLGNYVCADCGHEQLIDQSFLGRLLYRPINSYLTGTKRAHSLSVSGKMSGSVRFDFGASVCAFCDAALPLPHNDWLENKNIQLSCEECGAEHRVGEALESLALRLPMILGTLLPIKAPPEKSSTVTISCESCGGASTYDRPERVQTCPFCQVRGLIPDDAWFQLKPRRRSIWLQILIEERAGDRETSTIGALTSERGDYVTPLAGHKYIALKPFPSAPPESRSSDYRQWILGLGGIDMLAAGGDLLTLRGFPSQPHWMIDAYTRVLQRYPSFSREWLMNNLQGEIPPAVVSSAAATMRHLQAIGRIGLLLGWVDEPTLWEVLEAHAQKVLHEATSWQEYLAALARRPTRGEHPQKLRLLLNDFAGTWAARLPWGGAAAAPNDWEGFRVRTIVRCPRCAWEQALNQLEQTKLKCIACAHTWQLSRAPTEMLSPLLFNFRRQPALNSQFVTDYTTDGPIQWFLERHDIACLRCQTSFPKSCLADHRVVCSSCQLDQRLTPAHQFEPIAPGLRAILEALPAPDDWQTVACPCCGGDLPVHGKGRLVACQFCSAMSLIPDHVYMKLRGHAAVQHTSLLFDSRLPHAAANANVLEHRLIEGLPIQRNSSDGQWVPA